MKASNNNQNPFPNFNSKKNAGFILASSLVAICVSTIIMWGMHQLIKAVDGVVEPTKPGHIVDFVRVIRKPEVIKKERVKPQKEPPTLEPPPIQNDWKFDDSDLPSIGIEPIGAPPIGTGKDPIGFNSDSSNMELTVFAPMYPERARTRGIEGTCDVVFTITKTGSVVDAAVDPNNCVSTLFHRSSVKAAMKFKFTPRYVDGEAVQTTHVVKRFTYVLE